MAKQTPGDKMDKAMDKKMGIKPGSPRDQAIDKKKGTK